MPNNTSNIHFIKHHKDFRLDNRKSLKQFLLTIFRKEATSFSSLNYIFCPDPFLLEINKDFLNHDFYTDIVTFNLAERNYPVQGEIYISIDRVKDNAKLLNEPYYKELHRVIFHGALHLCGFKDHSTGEKIEMRKKEDACLKSYFR